MVGGWYCFHQGDWDEGLKFLAKGSDAAMKSLAAAELASKPGNAEERVARGDAWWNLAEKAGGKPKSAMRQHAGQWYQEALPDLPPGLEKSKVEKRLAQVAAEPLAEAAEPVPRTTACDRPVAPFDEKTAKQHQARWAKYLRVPVVQTNSIGMKLVLIPPGEFQMGSPKELIEEELRAARRRCAGNRDNSCRARGRSTGCELPSPIGWARRHVTQEEYQRVMGINPSKFRGDPQRPVEQVFWDDAAEFCRQVVGVARGKGGQTTVRLAHRSPVGVCLPGGNDDALVLRATTRRDLPMRAWFTGNALISRTRWAEEAERLGALRHARRRVGLVPGFLRRRLLREFADGRSHRAGHEFVSRLSRRELFLFAQVLPFRLPLLRQAHVAEQRHRLPRRGRLAGQVEISFHDSGRLLDAGGWEGTTSLRSYGISFRSRPTSCKVCAAALVPAASVNASFLRPLFACLWIAVVYGCFAKLNCFPVLVP